ncbi:MAG: hypothetical protein H0V91_01655 [Flavisolibacter sp.]|nr:hypothetical protein [Flavisolibacter sp.]
MMKNNYRNLIILLFVSAIGIISMQSNKELPAVNIIKEENKKPGTSDWLIKVPFDTCSYPDHEFCRRKQIEGYCSQTSVKGGEALSIFVSADPASDYSLHIYRMGYYGDKGGRLMKIFKNLRGKPQAVPEADKQTNFFECKWDTAVTLTIPKDRKQQLCV